MNFPVIFSQYVVVAMVTDFFSAHAIVIAEEETHHREKQELKKLRVQNAQLINEKNMLIAEIQSLRSKLPVTPSSSSGM